MIKKQKKLRLVVCGLVLFLSAHASDKENDTLKNNNIETLISSLIANPHVFSYEDLTLLSNQIHSIQTEQNFIQRELKLNKFNIELCYLAKKRVYFNEDKNEITFIPAHVCANKGSV